MAELKIAAYQMTVGADLDTNFNRIKDGIETASKAGARLIALPECALSSYPPYHTENEIDTARIADLNSEVCDLAKTNKIWVVLGTIVKSAEGLLNSALVITDTGEIAGRYDKLHLFPGDSQFFTSGNEIPIFSIDGVKFGVTICYDLRFPEPFRYLRELGAQFIFNILNACEGGTWKRPVMEGTLRTRASENSCYIIAANASGPLQMVNSGIYDPLGLSMATANYDHEEIIHATIDTVKTETGYFYDRRVDQFESFALKLP